MSDTTTSQQPPRNFNRYDAIPMRPLRQRVLNSPILFATQEEQTWSS